MARWVWVGLLVLSGGLAVVLGRSPGEDRPPPLPHPADRAASGSASGAMTRASRSAVDSAPVAVEASREPAHGAAAPAKLVIVIRDLADEPLAAVRIALESGGRGATAITGGDGVATFGDLAAGRYSYRLEAPGRRRLKAAAGLQLSAGELRTLELRLGAHDRVIAGQVIDQTGLPVAGIAVGARRYRVDATPDGLLPAGGPAPPVTTGTDGWFEINGLYDGEYELRTVASERYRSARTVVRAGLETALLSLVERTDLRISGRVTDTTGRPLADARVVPLGAPDRRAVTDAAGRYELLVATDARRPAPRFQVGARGHLPARLELEPGHFAGTDQAVLDAVLEPIERRAEVVAELSDGQGASVAGERVHLRSRLLQAHYQAVSGANGRARFAGVAAGSDYELRVAPQGRYRDYLQGGLDLGREPAAIDVVLEGLPSGSLSGFMVDPSGEPVPGFSLQLSSPVARGKGRVVSSGADGYFEVAEVPAGALILQTASMPQLQVSGLQLDAGSEREVEVVLDWGEAALAGRVLDDAGAPLAGAAVALSWRQGDGALLSRSMRKSVTDAAGGFQFSQLSEAAHRLQVHAPGHRAAERQIPAGEAWIEIRLDPLR